MLSGPSPTDRWVGKAFDDFDIWEGAFIPAEHWHFHRRVFERYRMVLPPGAFSKMVRRLRSGPSKEAQRIGSNPLLGREVWGVYVSDGEVPRLLYVVWHPRRQAVVTALPQSARRYAAFRRAREEFRDARQRRRFPVVLPVPGIPAVLRRATSVLWQRVHASAAEATTASDIAAPRIAAGRKMPFLTFEMTVEREEEDLRPAPVGQALRRRFRTVFWLRAILFRPWRG